jgi:hypothetical protein
MLKTPQRECHPTYATSEYVQISPMSTSPNYFAASGRNDLARLWVRRREADHAARTLAGGFEPGSSTVFSLVAKLAADE